MSTALILLQAFLGAISLFRDNFISNEMHKRCFIAVILIFMFLILFFQVCIQQQEDFANTYEGVLTSPTYSTSTFPVLNLGGAKLEWTGNSNVNQITFASGDYLHMKMIDGRISVTTQIRDSEGHLIGDIQNNHWRIFSPQFILDRNFNSNSLEIVDLDGNVIFQIQILGDEVRLAGFYFSDSNIPKEHLQFIGPFLMGTSTPLFLYPSIENPHVLNKKASYVNTGASFDFGIPPDPLKVYQ